MYLHIYSCNHHPDKNIKSPVPLFDFHWAICTSHINCLMYLYFSLYDGVNLGTTVGENEQ